MLESFAVLSNPAEQSSGSSVRFPLRLRRAWQRDVFRLGLQYIDDAGRVVPGQWCADHDYAIDLYERLDRATGHAVLASVAEGLIVLQPGGAEYKLPALGRLLVQPGAELLTHRPGRRAVVRFTDQHGTLYAKSLRPSKIGRVLRANRFVAGLDNRAFSVADIHSIDESDGLIVMRELPGKNLHDLAEADHSSFIAGCGKAGRALRSLHVEAPSWLSVHGATAEIEMLRNRAAGVQVFVPNAYNAVNAVCNQVFEALNETACERVALHRDFYDKQIVIGTDGEPGLMDFDTLGAGEPALDLANMFAHIELRVLQGACDSQTARAASEAFLEAYGPTKESQSRIPAYLDAARLRLAMLYAFRPKWAGLTPRLLDAIGHKAAPAAPKPSSIDVIPTPAKPSKPACPLVFIVGCPRSGTTMLERMLDAHPDLAMTHETHWVTKHTKRGRDLTQEGFIRPGTLDALYADKRFTRMAPPRDQIECLMDQKPQKYRRFVRMVFDHFRQQQGKAFVGDKSTGGYLRNINRLRRVCPESKVVHLVRDGREVCLSMMNWPKAARAAGRFGVFKEDPVATTAAWWRWHVRAGLDQGRPLGPDVYQEIRYQELVREPERVCAELCAFLGLDPNPAMASFYAGRARPGEGKSANAAWLAPTPGLRDWRTQMNEDQIEMFEAVAGDTLSALGFERKFPKISQRIADLAAEHLARWQHELGAGPGSTGQIKVMTTTRTTVQQGEIS